jgi:hypothetical protein
MAIDPPATWNYSFAFNEKVIKTTITSDPVEVTRFLNEIRGNPPKRFIG